MQGEVLSCPVPLPREQPQFSAASDRWVLRVLVVGGVGDTGNTCGGGRLLQVRGARPSQEQGGAQACEGGRSHPQLADTLL